MNKFVPLAAATAILAGGAWYLAQPGTPATGFALPANAQEAESGTGQTTFEVEESESAAEGEDMSQSAAPSDTVEIPEMTLGEADAPVKVTEYASFTCPHCATFESEVFPQIKENYIDTGKVEFTYREVYFDRYGLWAAMVARCEPTKFFPIAEMIYEKQRDWTQGEPAQIAENLKTLGKTAGLTSDQVEACLTDGPKAEAMYETFQENARADEVNSTPTFIVDGEKYSNMPYDEFAELLDARLEEAGAAE